MSLRSLASGRSAIALSVAAIACTPAIASASSAFAILPSAVTVDDTVAVTIETADGVAPSGPLEADPNTYTVVSHKSCTAPYTDGARAVLKQNSAPERVVMSGIDSLEADGTAHIVMDGVLADVATPGKATLTVECVRVSAGIPEPAPESIDQAVTITETEWQIAGITVTDDPSPSPTTDPTEEPTPSDPSDDPGTETPGTDEPGEDKPGTDEPGAEDPSTGGDDADGAAPGNGSAPGKPGKPAPGKEAPGKNAPGKSGEAQPGHGKPASPGKSDQAPGRAHSNREAAEGSRPLGFLPRTGVEIAGTIAAGLALAGAGTAAVMVRRRNAGK